MIKTVNALKIYRQKLVVKMKENVQIVLQVLYAQASQNTNQYGQKKDSGSHRKSRKMYLNAKKIGAREANMMHVWANLNASSVIIAKKDSSHSLVVAENVCMIQA